MDYSSPDYPVHGVSLQEYWRGLPFPPPGDLPHLGIEHVPFMSPALAGGFFNTSATIAQGTLPNALW